MEKESNESIWERVFELDLTPKNQNFAYNCMEYSSSCPDCGGNDRLSVFGEDNGILAICWGKDHGRSGCGKRFYRKDFLGEKGTKAVRKAPTKKKRAVEEDIPKREPIIEKAHSKIFEKDHVPTLLFAKNRGFSEECIKKFKVGSTFEQKKGFGLVLPVFNPEPYYQIRWIQWDSSKKYSKYQNPKGKKVAPAIFGESKEVALVFESLIDGMLISATAGYTALVAMGASLRDQDLALYANVLLVPDQDDAGERNFGLGGTYEKIPLPKEYKDAGELIQRKGLKLAKLYFQKMVNYKLESCDKNLEKAVESAPIKGEKESGSVRYQAEAPNDTIKEEAQELPKEQPKETEPATLPKYQYITSKEEAVKAVALLKKSRGPIALDTETTGLDFQSDKIRLVQLYEPESDCFLFDLFEIGEIAFLKPLEEKEFIIHYAPFDIKFLRKNGIELKHYFDTKMTALLVCPIPNPKDGKRDNLELVPKDFRKRDLSLKGLLKAYLNIDIPKEKNVRTGWEGELSEEKLEYAMKDVIYLHKLYDWLKGGLKILELEETYTHYSKALKAHIEMEWVGASIRKKELSQKIEELDPLDTCIRFIETYDIGNPNSSKQLSEYVLSEFPDMKLPKTPSGKQVKLDLDTLKEIKDKSPFFEDLHHLKKQTTNHREHVKLYDSISPITQRVHPSFNILSASSGRTISSKPNFQGQDNEVKSFVGHTERKNMRLTMADYSQQELRVFSLITKNKDFIELLERGEDGYKAIASNITGKDPKDISDAERKPFKETTLALLYGQGAKSLSEKLEIPLKETKKLYQDIKQLLNVGSLQRTLFNRHQGKAHIPTFFMGGFRPIRDKWKTLKEYQLINYCIQGTASNIGILALNRLSESIPKGVNIVGYIHDEFLLEHEESQTEKVKEIVSNAMEEAFLDCFPLAEKQRKYLVKVKTGDRWEK